MEAKNTGAIIETPKNEIALRLACVDRAMQMNPANQATKINETLNGAKKILDFVTDNGTLPTSMLSPMGGIMDILPYVGEMIAGMANIPTNEPESTKPPKKAKKTVSDQPDTIEQDVQPE